MNVLLVSQCSGRALNETRRILDQFAERRGTRTWQTPITQQGLDTLARLLRRTARRNTAVACHWIRGLNHTELVWIVGDARRFNAEGTIPTNVTTRDVLRRERENDWLSLETIRLLAKMAGLFHDIGKASDGFQHKLTKKLGVRDAYRHEWVSLRLFQAFVGDDDDAVWLARLGAIKPEDAPVWLSRLVMDGCGNELTLSPFKRLPPLAQIIGWLIVSHHFLPVASDRVNVHQLSRIPGCVTAAWNRADADATDAAVKACWTFRKGLPFASRMWCADVTRVAQRMQQRPGMLGPPWLDNPYVAHLSRLSVMLADHHYSSLPSNPDRGDSNFRLFANTDARGQRKQRLDEHLLGVGSHAGKVVRVLPRLLRDLPRIARHRGFSRRSPDNRFRWQDKAYDLATGLRRQSERCGFFGVDMASTGCGKTLANGRILYGLADPERGARFSIALGLRALTLQTGEAYRTRLNLGSDVLAVRVGGGDVKTLFARSMAQQRESGRDLEQRGSESAEPLLDTGNSYVHFEGSLAGGPFKDWFDDNPNIQRLLSAPILVSTIDHLIPATEGTRGGQQIAPMLRLASSDLVLDEPDDFDLDDLPALTRLVHWAGLLGSRVLLSSATLAPALVQGLFGAYQAGRAIYQKNHDIPDRADGVCCAWFDENRAESSQHADSASFAQAHHTFADQRLSRLARVKPRRRALIHPIDIAARQEPNVIRKSWAEHLLQPIAALHADHHSIDPATGKRVSFGLIRMAHIDPLIDTALALFAASASQGHRIHLCCYHSRFPLLLRSSVEQRLDRLLNRADESAVFQDAELRSVLAAHDEPDEVFVVLATPVAEVGRDHDYDWAIVEPSSMRSVIQLAGRVMRHRDRECITPNLYLLDTNLASLEQPGRPAFCRPGFENTDWRLDSHHLTDLLTNEQWSRIDAGPRIVERERLKPERNLVDLEHARLRARMLGKSDKEPFPVTLWWETQAHLTGVLQKQQRFRADPGGERIRYVFDLDEDTGATVFSRLEADGQLIPSDSVLQRIDIPADSGIQPWGITGYLAELERLAEELDLSLDNCARRFGWVDLYARDESQGWCYHPALGLRRRFCA